MTDRIADVRVTPIAFRDPPLLNVAGVHQPWALRSIIVNVQAVPGMSRQTAMQQGLCF